MATDYFLNGQFYSTTSGSIPAGAQLAPPGSRYEDFGVQNPYANGNSPRTYELNGQTYNVGSNTPVNSQSLAPNPPINLPRPAMPINQNGTIFGANQSLVNNRYGISVGENGNLNFNPSAANPFEFYLDKYLNNMPQKPSSEAIYNSLPEKAAYESALRQVNDYTNQINAITTKSQADQLAVMGQGRGIPEAIIGGQQAQISKEAAIKALPLQALLANAQGNLQLAQQHLDTVFKLRMDDVNNQYQYKTKVLEAVYDFANASETRRLNELQKSADRNYSGVTNAVNFAQSLSAKLLADGMGDAAARLTQLDQPDPNSRTFRQDLARYNQQIANIQRTAIGSGSNALDLSGYSTEQQSDPFVKLLASTKGGKPITDTFAQSLNKGLNVLGQIGGLQTNIKDVKTGPILGAFKGANPWDTNAQTIKAQLNAIVPNLARGVYGEVGVLTDNDIAQYSKTLPNLKSTEAIRNAVLGITVDLIGKSIKRTLEINAANKKDVSGFIDIYLEMNRTRDSIFSQIPGYKPPVSVQQQNQYSSMSNADFFNSIFGTLKR